MENNIKALKEELLCIANYLFIEVHYDFLQLRINYDTKKNQMKLPINSNAYKSSYYKDLALYKAKDLLCGIIREYIDVSYNAIRLTPEQIHTIYGVLKLQQKI